MVQLRSFPRFHLTTRVLLGYRWMERSHPWIADAHYRCFVFLARGPYCQPGVGPPSRAAVARNHVPDTGLISRPPGSKQVIRRRRRNGEEKRKKRSAPRGKMSFFIRPEPSGLVRGSDTESEASTESSFEGGGDGVWVENESTSSR